MTFLLLVVLACGIGSFITSCIFAACYSLLAVVRVISFPIEWRGDSKLFRRCGYDSRDYEHCMWAGIQERSLWIYSNVLFAVCHFVVAFLLFRACDLVKGTVYMPILIEYLRNPLYLAMVAPVTVIIFLECFRFSRDLSDRTERYITQLCPVVHGQMRQI